MAIRFIVVGTKNPAPIYVRVCEGRNVDIKVRTKFTINPIEWSKPKEQPKNLKDVNNKRLNEKLIQFKVDLTAKLNQRTALEVVNTKWLKDIITPPPPPQQLKTKPTDVLSYFELFHNEKQNELAKGEVKPRTLNRLTSTMRLFERYQTKQKQIIQVIDIDNDFKASFEQYCISQNYAPNTIARAISYVKTICRFARSNGIETNVQMETIKTKFHKSEHIYLSFDELEIIEKTDCKLDYLENAKDWLIISCYTGQRVSDFMQFNKNQIRNENGKYLIEFTQVKTDKIMTIPLHKKVLSILEKRNGNFPRATSDQKYNDYIKEVCKLAKLNKNVKGSIMLSEKDVKHSKRRVNGLYEKWQLVSSHIGRRSFATNFYGIIPTSLLISATGHSTETMFLKYIGKTDTQKANQLAEYF